MSHRYADIQLTAEMSVSLDRLTNQRQATVADDVGTGLFDNETFHFFTYWVMFYKNIFANSTLKCDTPLRSLNQFSKDRFRLLEPEAFPWSQVQPPFYPEYKLIADRSHIDSFRDVLPQQSVKVLIQAALPR